MEPETPDFWEGTLSPVEDSELTGSVAAISRDRVNNTEVGIEVVGGEEGDRWVWLLLSGTCAEPGEPVASPGDFPVLEAEEEEDPEPDPEAVDPNRPGQAVIVRAVGEVLIFGTTLDRQQQYHATVAAEAEPDSLLACGELDRQLTSP